MPKENNAPSANVPDTTKAGGDARAITSPFNYTVDEEEERAKAMERASLKIPNDPRRPIL